MGSTLPETTSSPGFRVLLRMRIHPGMEHEFEQTWKSVAEAVTGNPDNLGHWLMRDTTEESVYYIGSDWVDEERFRRFESSPEHVAHRQRLHPYRAEGSITLLRVVSHMAGAAGRPR